MPFASNPMNVCLLGCLLPPLWKRGADNLKRVEEVMRAGVAKRRTDSQQYLRPQVSQPFQNYRVQMKSGKPEARLRQRQAGSWFI